MTVLCSRHDYRSLTINVERRKSAFVQGAHRREECFAVGFNTVCADKVLTVFGDEPVGEIGSIFNIGIREFSWILMSSLIVPSAIFSGTAVITRFINAPVSYWTFMLIWRAAL